MLYKSLLILKILLAFCLFISSASAEDPMEREQSLNSPAGVVLDRHLAAFAARDVDAIMEDYTDDSVFITPQGTLKGKEEIRQLFEELVREFSSPQAVVNIKQRYSHGPVAYITWSGGTADSQYEFATDTIYVVNNRIQYQTFAATMSD